jgi:hypothetical protein
MALPKYTASVFVVLCHEYNHKYSLSATGSELSILGNFSQSDPSPFQNNSTTKTEWAAGVPPREEALNP